MDATGSGPGTLDIEGASGTGRDAAAGQGERKMTSTDLPHREVNELSTGLPHHEVNELEAEVIEDLLVYGKKKWVRIDELSTSAVAVYETSSLPVRRIALPFWRGFQDYAERMAKALVVLAMVEERKPWEVLSDARTPKRVLDCYKSMTALFHGTLKDTNATEDEQLILAFRIQHFEKFAARRCVGEPPYASQLQMEMGKHKNDLGSAGLHTYANNTSERSGAA